MIDAKPLKRYRASKEEWAGIHKAFTHERCWICSGRWSDLHHILSRGQGGDDVVANLAPLCRECHTRVEQRDIRTRSLLRGALLPSHYEYLAGKLDDRLGGWLERNYPSKVAA